MGELMAARAARPEPNSQAETLDFMLAQLEERTPPAPATPALEPDTAALANGEASATAMLSLEGVSTNMSVMLWDEGLNGLALCT